MRFNQSLVTQTPSTIRGDYHLFFITTIGAANHRRVVNSKTALASVITYFIRRYTAVRVTCGGREVWNAFCRSAILSRRPTGFVEHDVYLDEVAKTRVRERRIRSPFLDLCLLNWPQKCVYKNLKKKR